MARVYTKTLFLMSLAQQRVAVIISGAYRTLTDCNGSIAHHIFDANPSVEFDVYAYLTTDVADKGKQRMMERAVRFGRACVAAVRIESNAAVTSAVHRDMPHSGRVPFGRGTAHGKAGNIIKMFRGIALAWKLLDEHVATQRMEGGNCNRTARNPGPEIMPVANTYRLVLRLRPDLCFCGPLDLQPALDRPGEWWLPWASPSNSLAFDQIAVGSPAMMSVYASAYGTTVRGLVAAATELYPEQVMWRHLAEHGGSARGRIATLSGFSASLARGHRTDGIPHLEDPFGKLRADLSGFLGARDVHVPPYACKHKHVEREHAGWLREGWRPHKAATRLAT